MDLQTEQVTLILVEFPLKLSLSVDLIANTEIGHGRISGHPDVKFGHYFWPVQVTYQKPPRVSISKLFPTYIKFCFQTKCSGLKFLTCLRGRIWPTSHWSIFWNFAYPGSIFLILRRFNNPGSFLPAHRWIGSTDGHRRQSTLWISLYQRSTLWVHIYFNI